AGGRVGSSASVRLARVRMPAAAAGPHQASPCRGAPHNKGKKYPYFRKKASFEQNSGILWPYFSAVAPQTGVFAPAGPK
ncbi:hypothetical protein, partial [Paenibacillus timonensis]